MAVTVDWQKIKTEYVTGNASYRELAQKYGVHYTSIAKKAKKENWHQLRQQQANTTQTKMIQAVEARKVDRAARFLTVADKLLDKIEAIVETAELADMPAKSVRALTAAVKDLKEIQMIRSDADIREQEARIAKLIREAEKGEAGDTGAFGVVLLPAVAPIPAPPEEDSNG